MVEALNSDNWEMSNFVAPYNVRYTLYYDRIQILLQHSRCCAYDVLKSLLILQQGSLTLQDNVEYHFDPIYIYAWFNFERNFLKSLHDIEKLTSESLFCIIPLRLWVEFVFFWYE